MPTKHICQYDSACIEVATHLLEVDGSLQWYCPTHGELASKNLAEVVRRTIVLVCGKCPPIGRVSFASDFVRWSVTNKAVFRCPWCGGYKFGSSGLSPHMVRRCNGEDEAGRRRTCKFTWNQQDDHLYFFTASGQRYPGAVV